MIYISPNKIKQIEYNNTALFNKNGDLNKNIIFIQHKGNIFPIELKELNGLCHDVFGYILATVVLVLFTLIVFAIFNIFGVLVMMGFVCAGANKDHDYQDISEDDKKIIIDAIGLDNVDVVSLRPLWIRLSVHNLVDAYANQYNVIQIE